MALTYSKKEKWPTTHSPVSDVRSSNLWPENQSNLCFRPEVGQRAATVATVLGTGFWAQFFDSGNTKTWPLEPGELSTLLPAPGDVTSTCAGVRQRGTAPAKKKNLKKEGLSQISDD